MNSTSQLQAKKNLQRRLDCLQITTIAPQISLPVRRIRGLENQRLSEKMRDSDLQADNAKHPCRNSRKENELLQVEKHRHKSIVHAVVTRNAWKCSATTRTYPFYAMSQN